MKTILSLISLFFVLHSFSQDYVIQLVNRQDSTRVKYIEEGKKVRTYNAQKGHYTGRVGIENDSAIVVSGFSLPIQEITSIRANSTGLTTAKVGGAAIMLLGLTAFSGGSAVLFNAFTQQSLSNIVVIPIGVILCGGGVFCTLSGLSIVMIDGVRFDLVKEWELKIVPISSMPINKKKRK